jgi:hypothetical protein
VPVQVFPFAVLIVLLIGAFLGFWLVRRFVLDPTGSPDKDTATFVEWAIKLTAFLMLFLVSFCTQFPSNFRVHESFLSGCERYRFSRFVHNVVDHSVLALTAPI